jgi:predicted lipoprotein with Yx(FWY)xxD motif
MGEDHSDPDKEVQTVKRLLILGVVGVVVVVAGVAAAIAATGGGTSGSAQSGGATVSMKQIPGKGTVLIDSRGRALYRSDQEKGGMVLCEDSCLSFWQPLTVTGTPTKSSSLPGKLGTVKRPDGGRQVTYAGRLLYSFKLDKAGKVTGDGFKDAFGGQKFTWHVAHPLGAKSAPAGTTTTTPSYSIPGY